MKSRLGSKSDCLHPQLRQVITRKQIIHPVKKTQLKCEALQPQQGNFRCGRGHRLPHAPAIGGCSQHENEEQKKWIGHAGGENRHQCRPDDVRRVHQPAKVNGGLFAPPQQQYDNDALGNIERQQAVGPKGVADFPRIHPDGDQGRNSEENASCSQPSFDAAYFAGTDGSPLPPQKPMSQRLE